MGCQLCHEEGYPDTPAQVHHIREGQGMGQRGKDVIPLCPFHHTGAPRYADPDKVIGFHENPREWRRRYGTEREVLARFLERMGGRGVNVKRNR